MFGNNFHFTARSGHLCRIKTDGSNNQGRRYSVSSGVHSRNGYTDLPRSKDKSKLSFELLDNSSGNLDQTLASRQDTLERKAYGIARERKGKSGWTIVFRYRNGNPENGRAVTMDLDGSNIRIEHKDFILSKVDKRLQ
jgi:hypothetical protein